MQIIERPEQRERPERNAQAGVQPYVLLLDDDREMRRSLARLIDSIGLEVESAGTIEAFWERYTPDRPGCLVLDMRLPGCSALDLIDQIHERGDRVTAIVITAYGDVPSAVRAMKAGVFDFIEKPFHDQPFLDRLQQAIASDIERRSRLRLRSDARQKLANLSEREREVVRLVARGASNKQIASELAITQKTVENYRAKAMSKLSATSVADLVQICFLADAAD